MQRVCLLLHAGAVTTVELGWFWVDGLWGGWGYRWLGESGGGFGCSGGGVTARAGDPRGGGRRNA